MLKAHSFCKYASVVKTGILYVGQVGSVDHPATVLVTSCSNADQSRSRSIHKRSEVLEFAPGLNVKSLNYHHTAGQERVLSTISLTFSETSIDLVKHCYPSNLYVKGESYVSMSEIQSLADVKNGPCLDTAISEGTVDPVMSNEMAKLVSLTAEANVAAEQERNMPFFKSCRLYPKAILFSAGLSMVVIMEGYDTWLLGGLYGIPSFTREFGVALPDGSYTIAADWQSALTNGQAGGQIIGLLLNGIISDRFGYRKTMVGSLFCLTAFLFLQFFAGNVKILTAAYILCGVPWGIFQTLTITYAAEVVPVTLRPFTTSFVNTCWCIGQLIASGVLKGCLNMAGNWPWKLPYAIQWIWPVPILVITLLAPESPWWLVRHNKIEQARAALLDFSWKARTGSESLDIDRTISMMIYTVNLKQKQDFESKYIDCFRGVNLRRTEITCTTWLIQNTCGAAMLGWGVFFMVNAGLDVSDVFSFSVGQSAIAFVGNILAWSLLPHVGRRTLYLSGQIAMFVTLLLIGGFGTPELYQGSPWAWATGGLLTFQFFIYAISIGPACYAIVGEMPSAHLRIKTVVLARSVYQLAGIVIGFIMPQFMNARNLNWRGKTAFFWAGTCLIGIVWTYFRLPEPNGLTYADLDVLFAERISARKFKSTAVKPFSVERLTVHDANL